MIKPGRCNYLSLSLNRVKSIYFFCGHSQQAGSVLLSRRDLFHVCSRNSLSHVLTIVKMERLSVPRTKTDEGPSSYIILRELGSGLQISTDKPIQITCSNICFYFDWRNYNTMFPTTPNPPPPKKNCPVLVA